MASATPGIAMPPLGRHAVDHRALGLLDEYLVSLGPVVSNSSARGVRCSIAAPREVEDAEFPVTIVFDATVSGHGGSGSGTSHGPDPAVAAAFPGGIAETVSER